MREITQSNSSPLLRWGWVLLGAGLVILLVGMLAGRALFPLEVPKPYLVEREKLVEVPVERIVEKRVPVEVIKYVDRVVEKRVEVPIEVVKYVERMVPAETPPAVSWPTPTGRAWNQVKAGMTAASVRVLLGVPKEIQTYDHVDQAYWYYGAPFQDGWVYFNNDLVIFFGAPSR